MVRERRRGPGASGGTAARLRSGARVRPGALVCVTAGLLVALACAARAQSLDDRVYQVAQQLMCPVCQGQTVAESDSTVAREMRTIIRQKLEAGESPGQIVRYFEAQFGASILAEPPRRGLSLALYFGPLAALLAGLAIAGVYIRRWAARPPAAQPEAPDPADLERISRELEARDR